MAATASTSERPQTDGLPAAVPQLRALAVDGLRRMYRPEEGLYAFRLRRAQGLDRLEGISLRYTAIVLIALADETDEVVAASLSATGPYVATIPRAHASRSAARCPAGCDRDHSSRFSSRLSDLTPLT